jgi:hypothetical protein
MVQLVGFVAQGFSAMPAVSVARYYLQRESTDSQCDGGGAFLGLQPLITQE